jgi:UDP:flavonoid glycosyltransferase YjiC (YdhE family)
MYPHRSYDRFWKSWIAKSPVFAGYLADACAGTVLAPFSQPQPDWPRTRTGFAFYDGRNELEMPPELIEFLDTGPPPIVFTLGSSAVWVARDFYLESIAAAKLMGRRAVLLIGDERNRLNEIASSDMIAVNYAPFEALLPRTAAMAIMAVRARHRRACAPGSQPYRAFAFDQPDNAEHAARLGGSRTLLRPKYKAERVAKELRLLLEHPGYAANAKTVGEQLRHENGAATACDLLEEVLRDNQPAAHTSKELLYAAGD